MKLRYFSVFLLFFIFIGVRDSVLLKLRFGCELVDYGNQYLVWLLCDSSKGVSYGVVDYKFRNGKLIVKRYIVDDFDDEKFYYCPEVEFYIYDREERVKYDSKSFSKIAKKHNLDDDFLSIDEEYLRYSNIDKEKCKMNNTKMR